MRDLISSQFLFFMLALAPHSLLAMGNHPESGVCNTEKPYQAICTHSLHNLEGWYGPCYTEKEKAQLDADEHAEKLHNGNDRYTGIKKALVDSPPGY